MAHGATAEMVGLMAAARAAMARATRGMRRPAAAASREAPLLLTIYRANCGIALGAMAVAVRLGR